ncbi:probetacellulin [Perognathus longimembris pacificus]|uniref:probetacellulin n=1 Tax=Perognathus longimembris pacificus TaxID=214514 RepID=UPI002019C1B5|nr:probetacellulin [Perognathus longimembris pacificus]
MTLSSQPPEALGRQICTETLAPSDGKGGKALVTPRAVPRDGKAASAAAGSRRGAGRLVLEGPSGPRTAGWMGPGAPGSSAGSRTLLLALALGLIVLHCVVADENSTRSPGTHGPLCGALGENCAATTTPPARRRDHFSRCPKPYKHYCLGGRCRFVVAEQTPSCICDEGYTGARCERVDLFYLRGDRGQILVICLIAVMVVFIILVIGVCTCCHPLRKHRRKRKKEEGMETLSKHLTPANEDIQETHIA